MADLDLSTVLVIILSLAAVAFIGFVLLKRKAKIPPKPTATLEQKSPEVPKTRQEAVQPPTFEKLAKPIAPPQAELIPTPAATEIIKPAEPVTPAIPSEVDEIKATTSASWLSKLRTGLTRSRDQLTNSLSGLFGMGRSFDEKLLDEIHEILFRSDLGVQTTDTLVNQLRKKFSGQTDEISWERIREALREEITVMLGQAQSTLTYPEKGPLVILVVGVNGVGKTTSIGKLAAHFTAQGKSVLLCAADTFRAAAIEQLSVWGDRLGLNVIKHQAGSDPAAVAYDAVKAAMARNYDVLMIDTAGRLHSKNELMDELAKIKKVIGRDLPGAPHEVWLVLDATTGQNALQQVKIFREVVDVTGLVVTKLDGTAKGGVVVSIINQHKLPIRYIGVGEKAADLRSFQPAEFAQSIL